MATAELAAVVVVDDVTIAVAEMDGDRRAARMVTALRSAAVAVAVPVLRAPIMAVAAFRWRGDITVAMLRWRVAITVAAAATAICIKDMDG